MDKSTSEQQIKPTGRQLYFRLLTYLKGSWHYLLLSIVGFIMYASMEPALAALLKHIVDVVSNGQSSENRLLIPLAILGIFLIRGLGTFTSSYFMAQIATKIVFDLRTDMFDKLVTLPSSYFHSMPTGRLLAKLTYDTEQVIGSVTNAIKTLLREGFTVIGLMGYMLYTNWRLSLLFLLIIPIIGVIVSYASKRFRKLSTRIQNSMGGVTDVASESIKGQEVIKIFGGTDFETKRFYQAANENRRSQLKLELTKALNVPIVQFIVAVALAALIFMALDPTISASMSAGDFVAFIGAAGMLSKPMRQLTEVNSILQKGISAAESIFEFLDLDIEKNTGSKQVKKVNGDIQFKQLNFTYPNTDKQVLNNVSISLPAGKTLALVGKSGGGKSTFANLIPRFYDVEEGSLLLDNEPINQLSLENLRKHIALVNQNVVLFNGSIRSNIAYGDLNSASDKDIIAAAEAANAWGFIQELELGLDTMVGENGVLLSGGQRQRIAIARAILKNAPILILDEATSALDSESERAIQQALDTLMKDRTTIAIAHRLSTIENADIIAVVDHGNVVEMGAHLELLEKKGAYARLHKQQFNDPEDA